MVDIVSQSADLILIVDDDRITRQLLRKVLEADGYHVQEAINGSDALEQFERLRPSLALVDALMPGIDGFAVCEQLSTRAEGAVPVIMITGLDNQEAIDRAFAAGATDFITKPIHWPAAGRHILQYKGWYNFENELPAHRKPA